MNNVLKAYQNRHIIFINEHTAVRNCTSCGINCYITKIVCQAYNGFYTNVYKKAVVQLILDLF